MLLVMLKLLLMIMMLLVIMMLMLISVVMLMLIHSSVFELFIPLKNDPFSIKLSFPEPPGN